MRCDGELVLSSLFALCSSRIFLAIMLNSKNSAGIRAIILLRKEKKQRLKLIGGFEAFKKFGGLYSKCKKKSQISSIPANWCQEGKSQNFVCN